MRFFFPFIEAPIDSEKERAIKRMKLNNESIQEVFAADQPVDSVYNNVVGTRDSNDTILGIEFLTLEARCE